MGHLSYQAKKLGGTSDHAEKGGILSYHGGLKRGSFPRSLYLAIQITKNVESQILHRLICLNKW